MIPLLALATSAPPAPTLLRLAPGIARIQVGAMTRQEPLRAVGKPNLTPVVFRKDGRYVVWDGRGITIRGPRRTLSTRLEAYPTSPRLFGRAAIRSNVRDLRAGRRRKGADALAGAVRLGSRVYLLPRWTLADGTPWLEALVRVDLDARDPKPELLGRFAGFTAARSRVESRLSAVDARIMTVVRRFDSWGIAAYAPVAKEFGYVPMGTRLAWLAGSVYAEETGYGTTVVGSLDLPRLGNEVRLETRGAMVSPLGPEGRLLRLERPETTEFADGLSGARIAVPGRAFARPVSLGGGPALLVWDDARRPTRGWILAPGAAWRVLARWSATPTVSEEPG